MLEPNAIRPVYPELPRLTPSTLILTEPVLGAFVLQPICRTGEANETAELKDLPIAPDVITKPKLRPVPPKTRAMIEVSLFQSVPSHAVPCTDIDGDPDAAAVFDPKMVVTTDPVDGTFACVTLLLDGISKLYPSDMVPCRAPTLTDVCLDRPLPAACLACTEEVLAQSVPSAAVLPNRQPNVEAGDFIVEPVR